MDRMVKHGEEVPRCTLGSCELADRSVNLSAAWSQGSIPALSRWGFVPGSGCEHSTSRQQRTLQHHIAELQSREVRLKSDTQQVEGKLVSLGVQDKGYRGRCISQGCL